MAQIFEEFIFAILPLKREILFCKNSDQNLVIYKENTQEFDTNDVLNAKLRIKKI